ncbi:hypothetical protein G7046_g1010 [Stylonectria norvegica]|nr:hypothetical protein G7046_g1010 [Stylonectria norvegica]
MSANVIVAREVLLRAAKKPEYPCAREEYRRAEFEDQTTVEKGTEAIKRISPRLLERVDKVAWDMREKVYSDHIDTQDAMGLRYVQWCVEQKLSIRYGYEFDTPMPSMHLAPADMIFTTKVNDLVAAEDAKNLAELKALIAKNRAAAAEAVPSPAPAETDEVSSLVNQPSGLILPSIEQLVDNPPLHRSNHGCCCMQQVHPRGTRPGPERKKEAKVTITVIGVERFNEGKGAVLGQAVERAPSCWEDCSGKGRWTCRFA